MPGKRFRLFLTLLAVSVVLMTLQNRWGPFRPFKFLSSPLSLFSESYVASASRAEDALRKYSIRQEEFKKLEQELKGYKLREQKSRELFLENRRLREALRLRDAVDGYVATAQVISMGAGRWSSAYVIDKGVGDSVAKDMAAVTGDGLFGKVQEAYASHSVVLPIDDPLFSAGVRLQSSRAEAVLSGAGPNRCAIKYVGTETSVSEGEVLVTSGLDGVFPPGIPTAFVTKVDMAGEALFHRIEAVPLVDTSKVEEVIIIKR